ncbi:beta-ketoacyl-ACP synthase II [Candidatus Clavichlamydia salmonicola]|uniref:beta-ketoacyl-ACP synthase II n=1 Tax=Candidatus Clavichlamydia salmonicola TaxID=469812 RepID=UPI001891ABF0|nr:beta-ketoacyl-ACP synthase II [Candidatus Clavichlamydia salmonicola]
MKKRRVVVTGMGVVSCFGNDVDVFYQRLLQGDSGVRTMTHMSVSDYSTRFSAFIEDFNPGDYIDKKQARRIDPVMAYGMVAAKKALEMSGWQGLETGQDPFRYGVVVGVGLGGLYVLEKGIQQMAEEGGFKRVSPFFIPYSISNITSALIGIDVGFMGPNYSISTACATGNYSILAAMRHIQMGEADLMLCGGSEAAINHVGLSGFIANKALSQRNDDPKKASRPWDIDRDGFVMGEGAGVLCIEELEHAKARGAVILGELLGGSMSCDAYHITAPRQDGLAVIHCMEQAIKEAGVDKRRVNYVNAHATSTSLGDLSEAIALKTVFVGQEDTLKVNGTKSLIGHGLGAAGGLEAIVTLKAIAEGKIHPTLNVDNPIPEMVFDFIKGEPQLLNIDLALSNSFGFGGHNASLLMGAFHE